MLVEVTGDLNGFSFCVRGNVNNLMEKCVPCIQYRCGYHNLLYIQCFKKAFFPVFFLPSRWLAGVGLLCEGVENLCD